MESTKFVMYKQICGDTVAIMADVCEEFPINKRNLKIRLKNLKRQKLSFDQTEKALNNFPVTTPPLKS